MTPTRIQRKRTKGWRMPENAVYVGRPTKWGNPYKIADCGDDSDKYEWAVYWYKFWLATTHAGNRIVKLARKELRGKDLACFCPLDKPCHADILLRIANED